MLGQQQNKVKQKVQAGELVFGFVCRTLSPTVVELVGLSGFDFVWLDMEHTSASFETIEDLCRAADAAGIESLVRVPDKSPSSISRVLETGVSIVNVPHVEDRGQAEAIVEAARYAPAGQRGFCATTRGTRYGFDGNARETFAAANERTMIMVQIESGKGVENCAEICAVAGVDAVFVGLADLSQSLGVSGQLDHSDVVASARSVLATARKAGKVGAMLVDTFEDATRWVAEGARIFPCGVDVPTIGKTFVRIRQQFDSLRTNSQT
jgi:4-hydroxy-2-oxoheptanedioate aldolase